MQTWILAISVSNSSFYRFLWKKGWSLLPHTVKKNQALSLSQIKVLISQIIVYKHDPFQQDFFQLFCCLKDQEFLWIPRLVFMLCCPSPIRLKSTSPWAACFTLHRVWVKIRGLQQWLHVERPRVKKSRSCVCQRGGLLLLPVLKAATWALTIAFHSTVIPMRLQWASVLASRLGDKWSLRKGIPSSSEECCFPRLCIQDKETSSWSFPIGFLAL